jgi:DNA polymerase
MFIGQAPGAQEDKLGKPFVGIAGKLFTELLHSIGLNRKDIFVTSPVRCFPPKNRKPKKDELKSCRPYLNAYVSIIKPKKIVLMGETAFHSFFPGEKLKSYRGNFIKKKDIMFFPTYHPSAGMRFPKIKKIIMEDFKKLK